MEITKECINDTTIRIIKYIIDNMGDSMAKNNESIKTADFTAPFMEICGALYLANELKNIIDNKFPDSKRWRLRIIRGKIKCILEF